MGVDHKIVAPFYAACTMTACYSSAIYIKITVVVKSEYDYIIFK